MAITLLESFEHALPTLPIEARAISTFNGPTGSPTNSQRVRIAEDSLLQPYLDKADNLLHSDLLTTSDLTKGFIPATGNTMLSTSFSVYMAAVLYLMHPLAMAVQAKYPNQIGHSYEVVGDVTWATFAFKAANNKSNETVKKTRVVKFVHAGSIKIGETGNIHGVDLEDAAGLQGKGYAICDWESMIFCFSDVDGTLQGKGAVVPKKKMRKLLLGYLLTICEELEA
tara:strand:+ start:7092 stop:7769 length:678 start_codon:yes stop_codon:yes gene_type:complete